MEILGGILLALVLLAVLGTVTVAAFGLMVALGLITDWSFRRIFFVSFALGLFAPIVAAVMLGNAIEDGSLGDDLRDEITQAFPQSEGMVERLREIGPRVEDVQRRIESGEIDQQQGRDEIEQIINEQTGVQLDLDGIQIEGNDGLRIEID